MSRLPVSIAVAGRLCLPALRAFERLAAATRNDSVRGLLVSDLRDGGNDFPPHAQTFDDVVSGDLVAHESENGGQRSGASANLGAWKLRNGMGLAAQTPAGHGPAGPGAAVG